METNWLFWLLVVVVFSRVVFGLSMRIKVFRQVWAFLLKVINRFWLGRLVTSMLGWRVVKPYPFYDPVSNDWIHPD